MSMEGLRNILLLVAYDGSAFSGWQRLPGKRTIQGILEEVLSQIAKMPVNVIGSGRTDAGVHAQAQAANVRLPATLALDELGSLVAQLQPTDLAIVSAREVHPAFHARYRAVEKTYVYRLSFRDDIACSHRLPIAMPNTSLLSMMADACSVFEGRHRFKAFTNAKVDTEDFVRTVFHYYAQPHDGYVELVFRADGFMYNQVRLMACAVSALAASRGPRLDIRRLLEQGERPASLGALPACGLRLQSVRYRDEDYRGDPVPLCSTLLPFRHNHA